MEHDIAMATVSASSDKFCEEDSSDGSETSNLKTEADEVCLHDNTYLDTNSVKEDVEFETGRTVSKKRKIIETLVVYLTGINIAFSSCMIGPCLLDLEALTNSDTATIAMVFTGRGLGSLAGNVLSGAIIDKLNHWLLFALFNLVGAVFSILVPMCRSITFLVLCSLPLGLMEGFLDAGCYTLILMIWGKDNGPWMQAFTFIYSASCMITPFAVEPFLEDLMEPSLSNSSERYSDMLSECNQTVDFEECKTNVTQDMEIRKSVIDENKLIYAFTIPCLLKLLTFVAAITAYCSGHCKLVTKKKEDKKSEAKTSNFSTPSWIAFLVCLFLFSAMTIGLEMCMVGYLMTFSVKHLKWSKFQGATVTFVFLGSFASGCAIGIYVIKKVQPKVLLLWDLSLCVVFSVTLAAFINTHDAVLWVCAGGMGLGISSLFATTFTWSEIHTGVNAKVSSVILVGCGVADMAFPAITGALMEKVNLLSFVYVNLGLSSFGVMFFLILIRITRKSNNLVLNSEKESISHEDPDSKE